jgi:hypothetical protein
VVLIGGSPVAHAEKITITDLRAINEDDHSACHPLGSRLQLALAEKYAMKLCASNSGVLILFCVFSLLTVSSAEPAGATQYVGVDLYPIGNFASDPDPENLQYVAGRQVVGNAALGPVFSRLWPADGTPVDLNPGLVGTWFYISSEVVATNGSQQVGFGIANNLEFPGQPNKQSALLWNGSSASAVELGPPINSSINGNPIAVTWAWGTNGQQQVGEGTTLNTHGSHALLWYGTADSAIDLHPTNLGEIDNSSAYNTDGVNQVVWFRRLRDRSNSIASEQL